MKEAMVGSIYWRKREKIKMKSSFPQKSCKKRKKQKRGEREWNKGGNGRPTGAVPFQNCVFCLEELLLALFVRRPIC